MFKHHNYLYFIFRLHHSHNIFMNTDHILLNLSKGDMINLSLEKLSASFN